MTAASEAARVAVEEDLERLAELCRLARDELAPTRGGTLFWAREGRAEPFETSLRADLGRADCLLLAGTLDESVVGYACAEVQTLRHGEALCAVLDLFVEPAAREAGVGEVLIDAVRAFAAERGCVGVDATALPGNRATKNFFEAHGFTARLLVMHHRLRRDDGPVGPTDGDASPA